MKRSVIVVLGVAVATSAFAGPINPPPGPVNPTHKTLSEVEPRIAINSTNTPHTATSIYTISQPGSYYLTENLAGTAGLRGIEITSGGVALDLMGFELAGVAGAHAGVHLVGPITNVVVRNGSIRGFATGVRMDDALNCVVEDIVARGNAGTGIYVNAETVVRDCVVQESAGTGIYFINTGMAINCSVTNNDSAGIVVSSASVVLGCFIWGNGGDGVNGGNGTLIKDCVITGNTAHGTNLSANCSIIDCIVSGNVANGIRVSSDCIIRGNTCDGNGSGAGDGAGINVTGNDCRIEANNCTDNDRGIDVDGSGNWIVRNSCSANLTDWVFVANNVFGPIIDRRAPGSAAVNGFSAGSSLGSTDANANYSY